MENKIKKDKSQRERPSRIIDKLQGVLIMTNKEKQKILECIITIDKELDDLKEYQNLLALSKCDQDVDVGKQIKKFADDINELLNLLKSSLVKRK